MENKEYFVPNLEDLFVGYECERYEVISSETFYFDRFVSYNDKEQKALKKEVDRIMKNATYDYINYKITDLSESVDISKLRTKYLSKEDIEKEGWEEEKESKSNDFYTFYYDTEESYGGRHSDFCLTYIVESKRMIVENRSYVVIFNGEIKSINEFRKLMKWLKIK